MLSKKISNAVEFYQFFEWTQRYSTQEVCLEELNRYRRKNGFIFPKCSHGKSWQLKHRHVHRYGMYGRQVSTTAVTVLKSTSLPLPKRFAAVYLTGADKGEILVQRLSNMIGVFWLVAYRVLRNLCQSMGIVTAVSCSRALSKWALLLSVDADQAREVVGLRVRRW